VQTGSMRFRLLPGTDGAAACVQQHSPGAVTGPGYIHVAAGRRLLLTHC
jgi:hypothetical protein